MSNREADQFLAGLRVGDKIATLTRRLPQTTFSRRRYGFEVYTLTAITPKRGKFDAVDKSGSEISFNKDGLCKSLSLDRSWLTMEPVTELVLESILQDDLYVKAEDRRCRLERKLAKAVTKFEESSADPFWGRFTEASEALLKLLDEVIPD